MTSQLNSIQSNNCYFQYFADAINEIFQKIWKVFCDCLNYLLPVFCCCKKARVFTSAKEQMFSNNTLSSFVLSFLTAEDAVQLRKVSKRFNEISRLCLNYQLAVAERLDVRQLLVFQKA